MMDEDGLRYLHASVTSVEFGSHVTVVEPSNLYGCSIGSHTFIGPFVEIQRGVAVGSRCKIQSHSFICEMVTIGDDVFVGHGVMFINDWLRGGPAGGDRSRWGATWVGDHVAIGSNATILPVRIVSGCVIGAGAVVTKDCLVPGTYLGNPARLSTDSGVQA